uniref:Hybrid signal transduction histidine kinase M n=1 Tax=Tanacetum cinerariifolium TaxID=118510 RepID=A0A6L2LTX8_TANCI|nr:hybrid signal transduction histidine kinase M [Tanacetum cinerariifolium]
MWILSSLCDSLQEQVVITPGNAKTLWDHLKDLFHDNKDNRAINLDNELRSIKIGTMTVNEYCTKIRSMTDRLKNLAATPSPLLIPATPPGTPAGPTSPVLTAAVRSSTGFLDSAYPPSIDSSGDLYPVTKPSPLPTAFVTTSSSTWRQRLGHPGDDVLHTLSTRNFISCNKTKTSHVCHAWKLGKHVKLSF